MINKKMKLIVIIFILLTVVGWFYVFYLKHKPTINEGVNYINETILSSQIIASKYKNIKLGKISNLKFSIVENEYIVQVTEEAEASGTELVIHADVIKKGVSWQLILLEIKNNGKWEILVEYGNPVRH
ncbi:MAG: hypothetical protein GX410_11410 [Elusimicrobia bacterium]|nr:hypothetical protein [Elusimicrobiota bacterium]